MKITKSITRIGQRLVSVFLVLLVSFMLLTFPAIADTTFVTNQNYDNLVLQAVKPVVVILASGRILKEQGTSLEELKTKAENFFSYKLKVVVGNIDDNLEIANRVPIPRIYPTPIAISVFQKGEITKSALVVYPKDPTEGFKEIQDFLS